MLKKIFSAPSHTTAADIALLLVRLCAGAAFLWHGASKIQNPFAWMGPHSSTPGVLQAAAAVAEFGGALLIIFGFLNALGALGIAVTMAVAIYMHVVVNHDPFVSNTNGPSWELPATFLCLMILLKLIGPGKFSVDHHWFGEGRD